MTDFVRMERLRQEAPIAFNFICEMSLGSARRHYCAAYLKHRIIDTERPAASGYGIGVDHAAELRMLVEERLPEQIRDLQRP